MIDPRIEEVLEQCYVVQVEGGRASQKPPPEVLALAERDGYIRRRDSRIVLTEPGLSAARDVIRRHRLAERLLADVLSVGDDQLDADACQFEHILRAGLDDKVCILLGHPSTCPHGKPIPPGQCCRLARKDLIGEVGPLSEGAAEDHGIVAYLRTRDQREVQKLMAMGVLPGVKIRLIRRSPSYVFAVGYSQFTVDKALAEKVYVHWA